MGAIAAVLLSGAGIALIMHIHTCLMVDTEAHVARVLGAMLACCWIVMAVAGLVIINQLGGFN